MDKSHRAMPLFVGLLAALAGLGYFTFARNGATLPRVGDDGHAARLEREQQQKYDALNDKADRLAYLMQPLPSSTPLPFPDTMVRASSLGQEPITPQQAEAGQRQIRLDLDKRLETQPVDADWSLESTRTIERSLTTDGLKEVGAHPPVASRIECRSSMCRIQLVYSDVGSASDAGMSLNTAIAGRMPYTQVLSRARSDGGVDYLIYATRDAPAAR